MKIDEGTRYHYYSTSVSISKWNYYSIIVTQALDAIRDVNWPDAKGKITNYIRHVHIAIKMSLDEQCISSSNRTSELKVWQYVDGRDMWIQRN